MGALILLIGALLGTQYWLRRRFAAERSTGDEQLVIRARLRLGVRQEVVVVDWGGEQMVLGVGPSFIRPLHICPASPKTAESVAPGGADVP